MSRWWRRVLGSLAALRACQQLVKNRRAGQVEQRALEEAVRSNELAAKSNEIASRHGGRDNVIQFLVLAVAVTSAVIVVVSKDEAASGDIEVLPDGTAELVETEVDEFGHVYRLFADGRVLTDADGSLHRGDLRGMDLAVVDMTLDPDGLGYWITTFDARVFEFDATPREPRPASRSGVIGATFTSNGGWLLHVDGKVSPLGISPQFGSARVDANQIVATESGAGYWLVERDGTLHAFGDANSLRLSAAPHWLGAYAVYVDSQGFRRYLFDSGEVAPRVIRQSSGAAYYVDLSGLVGAKPEIVAGADGSVWITTSAGRVYALEGITIEEHPSSSGTSEPAAGLRPDAHESAESEVLAAINTARARVGLPALLVFTDLSARESIRNWSQSLAREGRAAHDPALDALASEIRSVAIAENIAVGKASLAELTEALMRSPTHRAAILSPSAEYADVSISLGSDGRTYLVQRFYTDGSECAFPNGDTEWSCE